MKLGGGSVPVEVTTHRQWSKELVENFLRIVLVGDSEKLEITSELFRVPSLTTIRLAQARS